MVGASQALMAGVMAMITGFVYETWGRTVAYATVAGAIVVVTAIGLWLARESWGLNRPLAIVESGETISPTSVRDPA
jgi:hypothetical protein